MTVVRILVLQAFILSMILSAATALPSTHVELTVPVQVNPGATDQVSITITANMSYDGIVILNATNAQLDDTLFGVSRLEFVQQGPEFVFQDQVSFTAGQLGAYEVSAAVRSLASELLGQAAATGQVASFDNEPPHLVLVLPQDTVHSQFVEIALQTSEQALCRMDENNVTYDAMTLVLTAQTILHQLSLELDRGSYTYYVSCRDTTGNTMTPVGLSFAVDPPPTARISLSESSPVKAGVLEIVVETSEPLQQTPELLYDYDGEDLKTVSLTGETDRWTGLLVVPETDDIRIATFHFSGLDLQGDTGTVITDGKVFVADTEKPPAPQSVEAVSDEFGVELDWYYDGEEYDYFRLYRSLSPDVGQANFLNKANQEKYSDYEALGGETYYYRVSAVDLAGNEGPLSDEVHARSDRPVPKQPPKVEEKPEQPARKVVLAPELEITVNNTIYFLESVMLDLDWADSNLKHGLDSDVDQVVEDLGLSQVVDSMKAKLTQYQAQLQDFWYMDLDEKELTKRINTVLERVDELTASTPDTVEIVERSSTVQAYDEVTFNLALDAALQDDFLPAEERAAYQLIATELQDYVRVSTDILMVDIRYLDNHHVNRTVVTKEISYKGIERLQEIRLVEVIPKSVAYDVGDIEFVTTGYSVLRDDPVVEWRLAALDGRKLITYVLPRAKDIDIVKEVATYVLPAMPVTETEELPGNVATGHIVSEEGSAWFTLTEKIMIILGMVAMMGLVVYYVAFSGASLDDFMAERHMRSYMKRAQRLEGRATRLELLKAELHQEAHEDDFIALQSLITRTLEHVENRQFERAYVMYKEIAEMYSKLPNDYRAQLYPECRQLHKKLEGGKK